MAALSSRSALLLVLVSSAGCSAFQPEVAKPPAGLASGGPAGTFPCDWPGDAMHGGETHHLHYLGEKPGVVKVKYNMFVKPDDLRVVYRGQVIGGTGGPRSGRGHFTFDWTPTAGDYVVDVVVKGELWGTRSIYAMTCPGAT
jgi:hypothetical protein